MRQNLDNFRSSVILLFCIVSTLCLSSCMKANEPEKKQNGFENVSMISLVSNPDKYSGKVVRTIAYLNIDSGQLTAYPSRDAYLARDNDAAFLLSLEPETASELAEIFKDRYSMIEGKVFYSNERYYEFIKLGKLTEVTILVETDSPRKDFGSTDIYIDKLKSK